ncbi:MAG: hypothetical protein ABH828_04625 [archaeon]
MKKPVMKTIFIIMLLTLTILSSCIEQEGSSGANTPGVKGVKSVGEFISNGLTSLAEIMWPLPLQPDKEVNFLAVLLTFILIFSLIYPASGKLGVFKDSGYGSKSSGARKAFAISVALLVTFFSPLAYYIYTFLWKTFSVLVVYGLVILSIVIFWWLTRAGGSAIGDTNTTFGKNKVDRKKINKDTKTEENRINKEERIEKREETALSNLRNLTNKELHEVTNLLQYWKDIRNKMAKLESIITTPEGIRERDQILSEIGTLLSTESGEEALNEQMEKVEKKISKKDKVEIKRLLRDKNLAKKLMKLDKSGKLREVDVMKDIELAEEYVMYAEKYENKLKGFTKENGKLVSNVRKMSQNVKDFLLRHPPAISTALSEVSIIIEEIEKEKLIIDELEVIETKVMQQHHDAMQKIKQASQIELEGEKITTKTK